MALTSLRVTNFRNLAAVDLEPCQYGLNIIYGNNGSGKTSLLEAINYLGLGRSFRNGTPNQLIRHQTDKFTIFAELMSGTERHIPVGIERELNGATRLRIAAENTTSMTEMVSFLPIRVMNSHSHHLLESGPIFRRKFLDWGLFYQDERFLPCWRQFERALKQRNLLLRDRRPTRELASWTAELAKYGRELDLLRRQYVMTLVPFIAKAAGALCKLPELQICYQSGWDENEDYAEALTQHYQEECRAGFTQFGPHRADLDIHIEGIPAKHFLSRGQQKRLVCAMMLAQGMMLAEHAGKRVVYLVDDLPAELDSGGRQRLTALLAAQQAQVFITAIEKEIMSEFIEGNATVPTKMFHVEHGCVNESNVGELAT